MRFSWYQIHFLKIGHEIIVNFKPFIDASLVLEKRFEIAMNVYIII